jgi:micrococcal nuclease
LTGACSTGGVPSKLPPCASWPVISVCLTLWACGERDELPDDGDAGARDTGLRVDAGTLPTQNILVRTVLDGDTVIVEASQGVRTPDGRPFDGEHIRLLGLDAPEIAHPPTPADCYGPESADYVTGRIEGRIVQVEFDPTHCNAGNPSACRDDYDRILAYIKIEGTVLNEDLLRLGYGRVFRGARFQHRDSSKYSSLEAAARSARVGMWTCP